VLLRNLHLDLEAKQEAEREAEAILDGQPPAPPITPPEPQRLSAGGDWAETGPFDHGVTDLFELRAKPISRFTGSTFPPDQLHEVADFLRAVAAAKSAKYEAEMQEAARLWEGPTQHVDEAKAQETRSPSTVPPASPSIATAPRADMPDIPACLDRRPKAPLASADKVKAEA
jgi:hypothetical protein